MVASYVQLRVGNSMRERQDQSATQPPSTLRMPTEPLSQDPLAEDNILVKVHVKPSE